MQNSKTDELLVSEIGIACVVSCALAHFMHEVNYVASWCVQSQDTPFTQPPSQLMQHTCKLWQRVEHSESQSAAAAKSDYLPPSAQLLNDSAEREADPIHNDPAAGSSDCVPEAAQPDAREETQRIKETSSDPAVSQAVQPIKAFLHQDTFEGKKAADLDLLQDANTRLVGNFATHLVPDIVLQKWGNVMDIVTPDSLATNCFTKTYTQYAKVGTCIACMSCYFDQ